MGRDGRAGGEVTKDWRRCVIIVVRSHYALLSSPPHAWVEFNLVRASLRCFGSNPGGTRHTAASSLRAPLGEVGVRTNVNPTPLLDHAAAVRYTSPRLCNNEWQIADYGLWWRATTRIAGIHTHWTYVILLANCQ